jgi:hypothetical protein
MIKVFKNDKGKTLYIELKNNIKINVQNGNKKWTGLSML